MSLQGTPEWHLERCGYATASCFADVLAKGEGKTRAKYLRRVVSERLTGKPAETFSNGHTARGTEQEPHAKLAWEAAIGEPIINVGFIKHASIMAGCSPDGLIGAEGGLECKSVIATVQLDTWLRGDCPPEHKAQIQGNLWITKRKWWEFASYCPDMPEHLQLFRCRVERDEVFIGILEREVIKFDQEAAAMVDRLWRMRLSLEEQLRESLAVTA